MSKLVEQIGEWQSLTAGFIIVSFLAFVGLLGITGHLSHLFLAVGYLLVAVFILTRTASRESRSENTFDSDAGFRSDMGLNRDTAGPCCGGANMDCDREVKQ